MKGGKRARRRRAGRARWDDLTAANRGMWRLHEVARLQTGIADSLRHRLDAATKVNARLNYQLDEIVDRLTTALGPHTALVPNMLKKPVKTQDAHP